MENLKEQLATASPEDIAVIAEEIRKQKTEKERMEQAQRHNAQNFRMALTNVKIDGREQIIRPVEKLTEEEKQEQRERLLAKVKEINESQTKYFQHLEDKRNASNEVKKNAFSKIEKIVNEDLKSELNQEQRQGIIRDVRRQILGT